MLTSVRAFLIAAVVLVGTHAMATPAVAGDGPECDPTEQSCDIIIVEPGEEPVDPPTDDTGYTPGPAECLHNLGGGQYEKVPCTSEDGSWSNASQCYWMLNPNQLPPPPGGDPAGAWYLCTPLDGTGGIIVGTNNWLTTPPPGLGLTPGQAARRIVQTMTFEGLDIGMAPQVNPEWGYRRGHVGVPVWLWAQSQTAQNWGPYVVTATLGGQTITVDANVVSVVWNMGDGQNVVCANAGTEYQESYGVVNSPSCGYLYPKKSNSQPDGFYTVTARSQWDITWTGGGQGGTIPMETTSTVPVEIRELQAVNVPPRG